MEKDTTCHNDPHLGTLSASSFERWEAHTKESMRPKGSLLFGLSGLRRAALPLPLGVFKPSARYW